MLAGVFPANSLAVCCAVAQAFLPLLGTDLTLKGQPGKILNMSSIYGSYTLPFCVSTFLLPQIYYPKDTFSSKQWFQGNDMQELSCNVSPSRRTAKDVFSSQSVSLKRVVPGADGILSQQGRAECHVRGPAQGAQALWH